MAEKDTKKAVETATEETKGAAAQDGATGTANPETMNPEATKEAPAQAGTKVGKSFRKDRKLQEKVAELEAKLAKEKDDYIRLMAEFENYRRRSAAERLELINTASEKIILEILPAVDDFERAVKALENSPESSAAKEGTEMIYNKLFAVLKAKGLKKIEVMGEPFDTETMEAVAQFPVQDEDMKGKVFDVIQNGYTLSEKVIRYAKVVVAQ